MPDREHVNASVAEGTKSNGTGTNGTETNGNGTKGNGAIGTGTLKSKRNGLGELMDNEER